MGSYRIKITEVVVTTGFENDYKKLPENIKEQVNDRLKDLLKDPMPNKLRFEKLKGFKNPSVYTIHVTPNHSHKISLEMKGSTARLRRAGTHKLIDRNP